MSSTRRSDAHVDQFVAHLICQLLSSRDLSSLTEVCSDWKELASSGVLALTPKEPLDYVKLHARFPYLRGLDLKFRETLSSEHVSSLSRFHLMEELSLENCKQLTDGLLGHVQLGRLTTLNLRGCSKLTWTGLGQLSRLPNLQHLNCAGVKNQAVEASNDGVPQLLSRLKSLVLGDTCTLSFVDDAFLLLVGQYGKQLHELDCSGCIDISDQGVNHLKGLVQLEFLSLQSCVRLSDRCTVYISQHLKALRHLNLRGCIQLAGYGVSCTALELEEYDQPRPDSLQGSNDFQLLQLFKPHTCNLQLAGYGVSGTALELEDSLDMVSLAPLWNLKSLTDLDLSHCKGMTRPGVRSMDEALAKLSAMTGLNVLDVSHFKHHQGLPRGLMVAIAGMTSLTRLIMSGSTAMPVEAADLPGIQAKDGVQAPANQEDESRCDSSLWFVSRLTNLEHLDISGWRRASPCDLKALAGLTKMKQLSMSRFGNEAGRRLSGDGTRPGINGVSSLFSCLDHKSLQSLEDKMACVNMQSQGSVGSQSDAEGHLVADQAPSTFGQDSSSIMTDGSSSSWTCATAQSGPDVVCPTVLDCAMQHLKGMKKLEVLSLEACMELTDDGLIQISELQSLTSLDVGGCRYIRGCTSLPSLAVGCTNLVSLTMNECPLVSDSAAQGIGQMTSLQSLSLNGCLEMGDRGVEELLNLHRLSSLSLSYLPRLTSRSLRLLSELRRLTSLTMSCCSGLEDGGVHELAESHSLTALDVTHCWRVTEMALERLKHVLLLGFATSCSVSRESNFLGFDESTGVSHRKVSLLVLSEDAIDALACMLAQRLRPGDVYCLYGKVGAGKSAFSRAFIRAACDDSSMPVPSPTYLLQNVYDDHGEPPIHHFDLYRLTGGKSGGMAAKDAERVGLNESFDGAVCLVEWAERLAGREPEDRLNVSITALDNTESHVSSAQSRAEQQEGMQSNFASLEPGRELFEASGSSSEEYDEYSDERPRLVELEAHGTYWEDRLIDIEALTKKCGQDWGLLLQS
eukprot:gene10217-8133_t